MGRGLLAGGVLVEESSSFTLKTNNEVLFLSSPTVKNLATFFPSDLDLDFRFSHFHFEI